MNWTVFASVLSSLITSALTLVGVILTNRKSHYETIQKVNQKVDMLEQKYDLTMIEIRKDIADLTVDVHQYNNLKDRMYGVEGKCELLDDRQKVANHRIDDLEKKVQ